MAGHCWVYGIEKSREFYIGITTDLENRMRQHGVGTPLYHEGPMFTGCCPNPFVCFTPEWGLSRNHCAPWEVSSKGSIFALILLCAPIILIVAS